MKRKAILFITLFSMALTPVQAQTTVNSEQGKVPGQEAQPAAVDKKAPVTKNAIAPQPADKLPWWPTDAQPAPVKDAQKGGYWWWPKTPGKVKDLWGNRGFAYVNKIIYDWRGTGTGVPGGTGATNGIGGTGATDGASQTGAASGTAGTARTGATGGTTGGTGGALKDVQVKINDIGFPVTEEKPSLLIKRTVKGHLLQFKENTVDITPEHAAILKKSAASLRRSKDADVIISAYKDTSALGVARTRAVEKFLTDQGVAPERIYVITPEKFQEAGLISKEEPAAGTIQVLIAEVKEVMIPGPKN